MEEIRAKLAAFTCQILSVLIDIFFLAAWLVIHWAFKNYILPAFHVGGVHKYLLDLFEIVFLIATLFPVVMYIVVDLYTIYAKARKAITTLNHTVITANHKGVLPQ